MMFASTRLGGAGSDITSYAIAVVIIPHIVVKHLRAKICGKLIYFQAECAEDKQVRTLARKSEKLVQVISNEEAN